METTHVRINVTAQDLERFKAVQARGRFAAERINPLCMAINRRLIKGYEATFDGLSVGILEIGSPVSMYTPENERYVEHDGESETQIRRLHDFAGGGPFFRGVSKRVQTHHRNVMAHRKVKPLRATVSLPTFILKATSSKNLASNVLI